MAMALRSPPSSSSMSNSHQSSSFSYDVFLSFLGEDTRKAFTDHLNGIIIIIIIITIIILMYVKYSFKPSSLVCSMAMVLKSPSSSSSEEEEEEKEEEEEEWALSSSSRSSYSMSNCSHQYSSFSYDVFLSFRGDDTRKTFTDHLYTALKQDGIRTFRDDDALERGRLLKPELEKAIQQSQVSLIVFSKEYATSKWCLDEVMMIMKEYDHQRSSTNKRREVVPVFYHIEPTDVRNQTGCFEEAFKGYIDEVTREKDVEKKMELLKKVEAWRASLRKAGSLTGMVLSTDGYEAKFISSIVKVIRKKLKYNALYIDEKLVGIAKKIAEIESWLQDPSPHAMIYVIDGMGGIGKTTIAKCVYNLNHLEYDCSCFLANINGVWSQPNGMLRLQSQLLSTILKSEKEETVWNEYEGTTKITDAMCNKKILLVLDDVTTLQQLNALLGPQRFFPGSKVIITTRHISLSTAFRVHHEGQTIRELSSDKSIQLFSLHAFDQNQPTEAYVVQSKLVDRYCKGLPLALKVLGSYLRGKSIDEWKDAMCKLEENPHPEIQKVLHLSYESLKDDNDKDLFLHIACFLAGEDKDYIVKLLAGCNLHPIIGIKNLSDRCLLYFGDGKVEMHQLIREMGQEVVRLESSKDPGKRSRLWRREDCINVLQENTGTKNVEGFRLDMENPKKRSFEEYQVKTMSSNETNFKIRSLEKMKNLMLLQLGYVTFSGKYKKLPKKLRLLRWHGFSLKFIPGDFPLEKLVVLDMSYSKLERVWDNYKFIGSLKILNLSYSVELIKTPYFGGLPCLEWLILKGCTSLITIDESIAYLRELVLLDVTDCRSLRNVPCLPRSLVSLQMSGCPSLGAVEGFQRFYSISLSSLLMKLNISNCNLYDNSFPNDWSNLVSLKELNIDGNNVTYLPKCIQSLPRLEYLDANNCSQIQSILGLPKTLYGLYINDNISLEEVQAALEEHDISVISDGCPNLHCMEGFFTWQSMDKVERKIIQKLGLGMELGVDCDSNKQKVLFEYGIFSTCVKEEQIPSSFMYKEKGPLISFIVPSSSQNRILSGFNLSLVFSQTMELFEVQVYNKTKNLLWEYIPVNVEQEKKVRGWISVWRCGNLLHDGDQIFVRINKFWFGKVPLKVEEVCINLIYDDDDDDKEEVEEKDQGKRKEVNDDDDEIMIRWCDRMHVDISDYVHPGMNYIFGINLMQGYDGKWYLCRKVSRRIIGIKSTQVPF